MTGYGDTALVRGMQYLAEKQASIAHNLANVNSFGFKRQVGYATDGGPEFGSILDQQLRTVQYSQHTDWTTGSMTSTGDKLNVGLEGAGFLMVRDEAGNQFYTRDGAMRIDTNGFLVDHDGKKYVDANGGPITFVSTDMDRDKIIISPDGTIAVSGNPVGQLGLFTPPDPASLTAVGNSVFVDRSGATPSPARGVSMRQGYLERSNVESLTELVNMITVQRGFEATGRVLSTLGRIKSAFLNTVGR